MAPPEPPRAVAEASIVAEVRAMEERSFNAWPALQTVLIDGWLLRFAQGFTKRANSINAHAPMVPVDDIVDVARPLYGRHGLPLIVRLSPLAGPDADARLEQMRWKRIDETIVMRAPIDPAFTVAPAVRIAGALSPDWAQQLARANQVPEPHRCTHDAILAAIRLPVGLASLDHDGQPIAWGIAVVERGKVGLFDIVTAPGARRLGAALRLVTSLMAWGLNNGASHTYLQVVATNTAAIALYERLGFRELYRYHYRVATD